MYCIKIARKFEGTMFLKYMMKKHGSANYSLELLNVNGPK
jgi:hypothetical protein